MELPGILHAAGVRLWQNQLQGATTTPHVPGRSRLQAQERLTTLAAALPASALNVQPANEAERTSLLHMLQRLASSSGRKELIAEVAAEQQELDARMESSVFAQELGRRMTRDQPRRCLL